MTSTKDENPDEALMLGMLSEVTSLRATVKQLQALVLTLLDTLEPGALAMPSQIASEPVRPANRRRRNADTARCLPK